MKAPRPTKWGRGWWDGRDHRAAWSPQPGTTGTRTSLCSRRISEFSWTSLLYDRFCPNKWVESLSSKHVSFLKSNATKTERKTNACVKFREAISAYVLVDDAILKDIQKKLEKLDMLDKINNQLSTIKHKKQCNWQCWGENCF